MIPADQKILKVLELLVMLSRSRQQLSSNLSEEEKATLKISKQLIFDSGLTVPEFTNAVHKLDEKGYLWHVVLFDNHLRAEADEFFNSPEYSKVIDAIKQHGTDDLSEKIKNSIATDLKKRLPPGIELDQELIDKDNLDFFELLDDGLEV